MLASLLALAGCYSLPVAPAGTGEDGPSLVCMLVVTLTTTVRTVVLRGFPDRPVSVGPDCSVQVKEPA